MEFDHGELGIYLFVTSSLALTFAAHNLLEYVNYPFHTAANNLKVYQLFLATLTASEIPKITVWSPLACRRRRSPGQGSGEKKSRKEGHTARSYIGEP